MIILLLHGNEPTNGRMFTTVNNENDVWSGSKCAVKWKSHLSPIVNCLLQHYNGVLQFLGYPVYFS